MSGLTGNSPPAAVQFVDDHRTDLIQRVHLVMPIADVLRQKGMIENEAYSIIHKTKPSQEQMRLLYETLEDGGPPVKAAFYAYLQEQHPYLVEDLTSKFVDQQRSALIRKVTTVMPIIDALCQRGLIEVEAFNIIHSTRTTQEQMSLLYEALERGGPALKANFYVILQEQQPHLVKYLNDTSGSSSSAVKPEANRKSNEPDQESCTVGRITYNTKDVLGEGADAFVYRGTYEKGPKEMVPVAVKKVTTKKFALREIQMLRESDKQPEQHANIIRWYGTEEEGSFFYIALELCDTSLHKFLSSADENPDRQTLFDLLYQIMSGLAHLHSLNIVHRDVKPENILLRKSDDGKMTVKISDFGISKKLDQKNTTTSKGFGTMCWMAPEHGRSDELSLDIFPAGCLFHYVLTGTHPFGDMNYPCLVMANIQFGKHSLNLKDNKHDDIVARDLIEQMLSMEPQKRPSAESILKHPFFWSSQKILDFFQDVSDWTAKKQMDEKEKKIKENLESGAQEVVKEGDWMKHLCEPLKKHAQGKKHKGDSIESLLRLIRNTKHHFNEYGVELQTSLGSIPDGFVSYFTSRFHKLLLLTYLAMRDCQNLTVQGYYPPSRTALSGHGSRE